MFSSSNPNRPSSQKNSQDSPHFANTEWNCQYGIVISSAATVALVKTIWLILGQIKAFNSKPMLWPMFRLYFLATQVSFSPPTFKCIADIWGSGAQCVVALGLVGFRALFVSKETKSYKLSNPSTTGLIHPPAPGPNTWRQLEAGVSVFRENQVFF